MACQFTNVPSGMRQTYETMANLLFYSLGCLRAPSGPVIKTRTSQHSTMKASLSSLFFDKRFPVVEGVQLGDDSYKLQSVVVDL